MPREVKIEGPSEQPDEPEPSWLHEESPLSEANPSGEAASPHTDSQGSFEVADIVTDMVELTHDKIAKSTGYAEFALDEKEVSLWRRCLRYMLKNLPLKQWPMAIAVMSLIMAEGTKVYGLLMFLKANGKLGGGTSLPPKPERVTQEKVAGDMGKAYDPRAEARAELAETGTLGGFSRFAP